jgi:hypothetical protein
VSEAHSKPPYGWTVGFGDSFKGEEGEKGENSSKEGDSPNLSTLSGLQTLLTSPF